MADPPTALFTAHNLISIGAVLGLRRLGAQRRIALVGFDDVQLTDLLDPPITVVAQDRPALGRTAARLLLTRLDGGEGPSQHVVVATRLVSGAPARYRVGGRGAMSNQMMESRE